MVTNTNGHRSEYEFLGWIVPSWNNPIDIPVFMLRKNGFFLLDDEGGMTRVDR